MRNELEERIKMYHAINAITLRGEIVVFGSTFTANFPFYELSKKYLLENAIYNRSVEDLTLAEAESVLNECVLELQPSKIFLSLGETDADDPAAVSTYGRILTKIKRALPKAAVFVLSVRSTDKNENDEGVYAFNEKLRELCKRHSATYLDVSNFDSPNVYEYTFKRLRYFFRNAPLSFSQAFALANS